MKEIILSTDGSALGNPNGPMGWAWADHAKNAGAGGAPGHEHDEHGYDAGGATNGTNQIGELCAVLMALRAHPGPQPLLIESDSQYAINCSTTWVKGWKRNGWKNSQKKPVKNAELIKAIDAEISRRPGPVKFKWVKGHAGNAGNELVDELARTYAGDCRSGARDGYLPIEGWQSLLGSDYARGTDVPPDVQLVLDGKADASSIHPSSDNAASIGKANVKRSDSATGSQRHQSIADLLAEPEGVPEYDRRPDPDKNDPEKSAAKESADSTAAPAAPSSESKQPSNHSTTSGSATNIPLAQSSSSTAPIPSMVPASASGLTVSGSLTFSPAPNTSPYFTGQPMPIHGFIRVEGYVSADGSITITDVPFIRH